MQLSNAPGKLTLPWAEAGGKNVIPVASQIGITPGAASFTDGFPPLTRTPIASGGIPPSGLDMNGVLFDLSAIVQWANAGAGYVWDSAFATNTNVLGYPQGAQVLRSDGLGYWLNLADNNQTNPESSPANWVPGFTNGTAPITMTNANVTLTPLQYGKPIIIITGALTANLNLVFPNIAQQWIVINSTTGAFTISGKTASGSGVTLGSGGNLLVCDGANNMKIVSGTSGGTTTPVVQTFSGAGNHTYTPTAGMKYGIIKFLGAGGGGGGASAATGQASGGAGAASGTYAKVLATATQIVAGGATATNGIVIGAGGAGGGASAGTGSTGGTTTVGTLVSCPGGGGAIGSAPTAGTAIAQASGNTGAATISGCTAIVTNNSQTGQPGIVLSLTAELGGAGGASYFGGSGNSSTGNNPGNMGGLGAGGGGASTTNSTTNQPGGAGGDGYVVITEYF